MFYSPTLEIILVQFVSNDIRNLNLETSQGNAPRRSLPYCGLLYFILSVGYCIFVGDVCDDDSDGDGVRDEIDNCIYVANPLQGHLMLNHDIECEYSAGF